VSKLPLAVASRFLRGSEFGNLYINFNAKMFIIGGVGFNDDSTLFEKII